jgi:hypothetical protein
MIAPDFTGDWRITMDQIIKAALVTMFADKRFACHDRYKYVGQIDGQKIGVVLATRSPSFPTHALNKGDLDRLRAAKANGKIAAAFVVAAKLNGSYGVPTFCCAHDAEEVAAALANQTPMVGRFGEFYVMPSSMITDESEPF